MASRHSSENSASPVRKMFTTVPEYPVNVEKDNDGSYHMEDIHNTSTFNKDTEKGEFSTIESLGAEGQKTHRSPTEISAQTENEVTFGFVMTMLGFSLTFITAEVIPLFFVTLFTVIPYDLAEGDDSVWGLTASIIAVGAVVPFVGTLADLMGRKGITLVSLGFSIVSMILLGLTPNMAGFIGALALAGIGIGIQLLTTIAAVTELVPTHKRGITIGYIVIGFLPFAPASVYGQLLAEHSWRYVPLIIGVLCVVAFIILAIWYKPPARTNSLGLSKREMIGRIDFVGGFLSLSGITIFLVGLNSGGQDHPWSSAYVISTLVVGSVLMVIFGLYEYFYAKYPLFPSALIGDKKIFFSIAFLCLTSGINFIPLALFLGVQLYTVYGDGFRACGVHLLPLGFCISGGAIMSAILMTVYKNHIHRVLTFFCVIQTVGLGCMAAVDPDNINTIWAPIVFGLIGVGGVLLPSQIVFSIISPEELIGTSVALSIVVRCLGQVVGVAMFFNIFVTQTAKRAMENPNLIILPALTHGVFVKNAAGQVDLPATTELITKLITTLAAGPLSHYAPTQFPMLNTPEAVQAIQDAGSQLYRHSFDKMYLIAVPWGAAAVAVSFLLGDVKNYMNENVAVHL